MDRLAGFEPVRPVEDVEAVLALVRAGKNDCAVSRETGVPRTTVRDWRRGLRRTDRKRASDCPVCSGVLAEMPAAPYAYLLGLYLGDGCISKNKRTFTFRLALDGRYPQIVMEAVTALEAIRPGKHAWHGERKSCRCVDVTMGWNHWPCLFPQHGPGRKHLRPIFLAPWQKEIADRQPRALIRGLIHSDGCRVVANDRGVASVRYHFSNLSDGIKQIYCDALDTVGISWTRSCDKQIAVYRKSAVRMLDVFVGPKR